MERIILFLRAAIMLSVLSLIGYFAVEYAPIFEKVKPTMRRLVAPLASWWEGGASGSKAITSETQAEAQTKGLAEPELFRPGGSLGATGDLAEGSVAAPFSSAGPLGQKTQRESRQTTSSGFNQIASASFQDEAKIVKAEPRPFNKSFNTTKPRTRLSMLEKAQLQITEAKPFGLRPVAQVPVVAHPTQAHPTQAHPVKVTAGTLQADTQLQQQLAELRKRGAVKYDLKPWGQGEGVFRFKCDFAIGENHDHTRLFEATGPVPAELVAHVLRDVKVWRTEQAQRAIR